MVEVDDYINGKILTLTKLALRYLKFAVHHQAIVYTGIWRDWVLSV